MTNADILREFRKKYPELNPIDYRPLSTLHYPKTQGIQIWLDNGDIILYFPKEEAYERGYTAGKMAAIDAIKNADVCIAWNGEISAEDAADIAVRATKNSVIASVENLQSVRPERKTGTWIKDNGDWFETMFKCSECGALIKKEDKFRSFFCYHCGADMRERAGDHYER